MRSARIRIFGTIIAVMLLGSTAARGLAAQLNNLVNELLNVTTPNAGHTFTNSREGWVYIRIPTPAGASTVSPVAILDGKSVTLKQVGNNLEAMHYVTQGQHA